MNNQYSDLDIVRFYYNETTPTENAGIVAHARENWEFGERLSDFGQVVDELGDFSLIPSDTSVSLIMSYARGNQILV